MTVTRIAQTDHGSARADEHPRETVGAAGPAVDRDLAEVPTAQQEWRWIPDPAEAEDHDPDDRSKPRSTWNDNLIRAMALAKLHGTW